MMKLKSFNLFYKKNLYSIFNFFNSMLLFHDNERYEKHLSDDNNYFPNYIYSTC